jgi:hypothetical protein
VNSGSNKSVKRQVRNEADHVRGLLLEWAAIPGSPTDEYDCLVDRVVSAMHRGVDAEGLADLIQAEFREHFGLDVDRSPAWRAAQRILAFLEQQGKV